MTALQISIIEIPQISAKIMTKFDSDRVLKLIGVAYKHSYSPIVVTEYMHNGDLVNYLRDESNVSLWKIYF